ncbi:MAG: type I methionyl aminopeptidase [Anaerolineales bacterium]|nr:type I methionyl aminopeptidase [Anaerolineales bacterium]
MPWHRGVVLKSARELEIMRRAGRINALALQACLNAIRPGATTEEIDAEAVRVLEEHGAESAFKGYEGPYPYPAVTTISINDELVHGIPSDRRLEEGDIVSVDCGSVVDGFVGDSAFTVGVGEVSDTAERLMQATYEALFAGIAKMRPENRSGDVSAAIQQVVEDAGFRVVREYTGHGVGRNMHEDPQVPNYGKPGTGLHLKPGLTVALEPMVLAGGAETRVLQDQWTVASRDGELTAHFEHTVAVTEDGPWILTALDEDDLDEGLEVRYNQYFGGRRKSAFGTVQGGRS